jgi:hypothetical protein
MSADNNKKFRFIVPVESLPRAKGDSSSLYKDIIKEFMDSKLKYAEVTLADKSTRTINAGLRHHLKKKGISTIKVRVVRKKVYLESKTEPSISES